MCTGQEKWEEVGGGEEAAVSRERRETVTSHAGNYSGEEPRLYAARLRAELGEDPGGESKARTIQIACFSPGENFPWNAGNFFLRAQCLKRRRAATGARLDSGDSRRGPQGGEWGSPWRACSHPFCNFTGLENNSAGVICGWERGPEEAPRD